MAISLKNVPVVNTQMDAGDTLGLFVLMAQKCYTNIENMLSAATASAKYCVLVKAIDKVPNSSTYIAWLEYTQIQPNTLLFASLAELNKYPFWATQLKKAHVDNLMKNGADYVSSYNNPLVQD